MNKSMISNLHWQIRAIYQTIANRKKVRLQKKQGKYFCIGLNKTGTTSWSQAMSELGFVVGSETASTLFFYDWVGDDYKRIVRYCRTDGQAFQDIPFSLPNTYAKMDSAFPGSKFILTVRDSGDQWYDSLVRFHSKHWSVSGNIPPTAEDLALAVYWQKGFLANYCKEVFRTPTNDPYNRDILLAFYDRYNNEIMDYFSDRKGDLLVVNVTSEDAYDRLCTFLGLPRANKPFPWRNKT